MKKSLFSCLTLLAIIMIHPAQARTPEQIHASGVLKVGVPGDYAPLAWHNPQGKLQGYDIDMAEKIATALHLKVEYVISSWPDLSRDLAADKFDIAMGGVTATPQRAQQFALTAPVVPNGKIALANCANSATLSSLEKIDRPEVKVVVNPGGTNESFVNSHIKQAQIIRVPDNVQNLQALRDKRADIMFTDLIEGEYYQSSEPGVLCLATPTPIAGSESYKVYMVKQEDSALIPGINQLLTGKTRQQLGEKWHLSQP